MNRHFHAGKYAKSGWTYQAWIKNTGENRIPNQGCIKKTMKAVVPVSTNTAVSWRRGAPTPVRSAPAYRHCPEPGR